MKRIWTKPGTDGIRKKTIRGITIGASRPILLGMNENEGGLTDELRCKSRRDIHLLPVQEGKPILLYSMMVYCAFGTRSCEPPVGGFQWLGQIKKDSSNLKEERTDRVRRSRVGD